MKINKTYNKFKEIEEVFQCPICKDSMELNDEGSFVCSNRHCFDLSSKGYINFIPNQKQIKYRKNLFENRQEVFLNGFYDNILMEIQNIIVDYFKFKKFINILDAGCGEGYYSLKLDCEDKIKGNIFAIDIVKDAIKIASKEHSSVKWIVGDISNIPLKRNSIDVIINILTPSRYDEFTRILSDNGIVIKVIPGNDYLQEIRNSIIGQLKNKSYSNEKVMEHFKDNMKFIKKKKVNYRLPVSKHQLACFLEMTPMTFGIDTSKVNLDNINYITIDLEVLLGMKKTNI